MRARRAPALALTLLVIVWALCVPMLHGHLPGSAAHVHDTGAGAAEMSVGLTFDTPDGSHTVDGGHGPSTAAGAPLPVASSAAGFVLVVSLVALTAVRPRPRWVAFRRALVGGSGRASPVGWFEVCRV